MFLNNTPVRHVLSWLGRPPYQKSPTMQLFGCTVEVLPPPLPTTTTTLFSHHLHRFKNMDPASTGPLLFFQICIAAGGGGGGRKSPVVSVLMEQGGGGVGVPEGVYKRASFVCRGGGGWCVGVGGWVGVACSHG